MGYLSKYFKAALQADKPMLTQQLKSPVFTTEDQNNV
jgi:hypothetical protein